MLSEPGPRAGNWSDSTSVEDGGGNLCVWLKKERALRPSHPFRGTFQARLASTAGSYFEPGGQVLPGAVYMSYLP